MRTAEKLYDEDFYAWTQLQARELQRLAHARSNLPLDLRHLAEEIRDVGKEQRNALRSWTREILEHLLLLQHSPASEPRRGCEGEIERWRDDIAVRLTPSLARDLQRQLPRIYVLARGRAERHLERHGESAELPPACPWPLDEVLGDFWPEPPSHASSDGMLPHASTGDRDATTPPEP